MSYAVTMSESLFAYLCCLLITRATVRPDLDPNCLTLMVLLKEFFKKDDFEKKISRGQKGI